MKVFIAAPFGQKLDGLGNYDPVYRQSLEMLHSSIEGEGYQVFASQRNENWGQSPLDPNDCVQVDYEEMSTSDVVIAVLGSSPSLGVCVELGWASALQIPLVIVGKDAEASSMIVGLHKVSAVSYIPVDLEDLEISVSQLLDDIQRHVAERV